MCWYLCKGPIYFILKGKCFSKNKSVFPSDKYKKNDKIILKYFQ